MFVRVCVLCVVCDVCLSVVNAMLYCVFVVLCCFVFGVV